MKNIVARRCEVAAARSAAGGLLGLTTACLHLRGAAVPQPADRAPAR